MYQGHKTKEAYIKAWKAHVRDLQWMFWETAPANTAPDFNNGERHVDAKMNALYTDIEAAADKLETAGKFKS
jgi:hypothetical protein